MKAIVTGASRGIGKAIALELASLGFDLALVGRDTQSLESVADEAQKAAGETEINTVCIPADLSDEAAPEMVVAEAAKWLGGIDLLVNCAGIAQAGSFTEVTPEQWNTIFAVNARTP